MYNKTGKIDIYKIVFLLMCLINIMNLFTPRYDTDDSAVRLPIQVLSGLIIVLTLPAGFFYKTKKLNFLVVLLYLFFIFVIVDIFLGFRDGVPKGILANYLRLLLWTSSIIFFILNFKHNGNKNNHLIRFYIILFLVVALVKIFQSAKFEKEVLDSGDVAGITVALSIPAIFLFFSDKVKLYLLLIAVVIIFVSIRRTAIIAVVLSLPFLFKEIRAKLKTFQIIFFSIIGVVGLFYAWAAFGAAIETRFLGLINGESTGGSKNTTYGSGRTQFWAIIYNSWADGSATHLILGNGCGSVAAILKLKYADIGHAHNDLVEIIYTFGLLGLCIWLLILLQLVRLVTFIKRFANNYLNTFYAAMITFLFVAVASGTLFKMEMLIFALPLAYIINSAEANMEVASLVSKKIAEEKMIDRFGVANIPNDLPESNLPAN